MATKKAQPSKAATAKKPATKEGVVAKFPDPPDKAKAEALAQMTLKPSVNAAAVIVEYTQPFGEQDIGAMMGTLSEGMKEVWAGDLQRAESMLYGQAHALQAIFMNLARRAAKQDYMKNMDTFMRMALKAQNQCRMTLETLATIKNPPVVFARQANINNGGQQQVNNGTRPEAPGARAHFSGAGAHAANPATEQTGLLEASNGERLDTGTAGTTSGADPHLEAVGAVHRPAQR